MSAWGASGAWANQVRASPVPSSPPRRRQKIKTSRSASWPAAAPSRASPAGLIAATSRPNADASSRDASRGFLERLLCDASFASRAGHAGAVARSARRSGAPSTRRRASWFRRTRAVVPREAHRAAAPRRRAFRTDARSSRRATFARLDVAPPPPRRRTARARTPPSGAATDRDPFPPRPTPLSSRVARPKKTLTTPSRPSPPSAPFPASASP